MSQMQMPTEAWIPLDCFRPTQSLRQFLQPGVRTWYYISDFMQTNNERRSSLTFVITE